MKLRIHYLILLSCLIVVRSYDQEYTQMLVKLQ